MGCSSDEALTDAKEVLDIYIKAATTFFQNTSGLLNEKIKSTDPTVLCLEIQGEEVSKEALLQAIKVDVTSQNNAYFNQQVKWLFEAIKNSDLTWRQSLVKVMTGNITLASNAKLLIKQG